jgi:hypothetical protein
MMANSRFWLGWRWLRVAATVAVVGIVANCYVPARFDAEIEISRTGNYTMTYEGYMAQVELFNDIRQKKVTPEEEKKRVETIKADFERDSATKEFSYFGQGHFKVKWVKTGDILASPMVTFFRRNENILSILYVKEKGQITIKSTPIGPDKAQQLIAMGLNMNGQLRVRTDARVVSHNATREETPQNPKMRGEKLYVWDVKSFADKPATLSLFLQ